jgi:hypothetical protein
LIKSTLNCRFILCIRAGETLHLSVLGWRCRILDSLADLARKVHSILRRQAPGPTKRKLEETDHGKESAEEGKKARSHQAVDRDD